MIDTCKCRGCGDVTYAHTTSYGANTCDICGNNSTFCTEDCIYKVNHYECEGCKITAILCKECYDRNDYCKSTPRQCFPYGFKPGGTNICKCK